MTLSGVRSYELQALTDIWTGDAATAQTKKADRLTSTGLLGSIRWWFEVLVRGLGGSPCDPSMSQKCCLDDKHCIVCELLGCTGWARKFRFDVRNVQGIVVQSKLTKDTKFRLRFTPLRFVRPEEWALIEATLRLISEFGALGGKTVLKPSSQNNKATHGDFGLVRLTGSVPQAHSREQLARYVSGWSQKPSVSGAAWASCKHMWFVSGRLVNGRHLTREDQNESTFNRIIGRPEPKTAAAQGDSWLAGRRAQGPRHGRPAVEAESKKVFSFRSPPRTFGFVQQTNEFDEVRDKLREVWNRPPSSNDWFISGDELTARLFSASGASR